MDPLDVLTRPAEPPDAVVRYADHDCGVIDLFLPQRQLAAPAEGAGHPLVIAIHGGFWHEEYDRIHLRPMANALVDRGFAVAVPEYRRGPAAWRRTSVDIQRALEVAPALVEAVAPGLVETASPFTLTGHSAGGHLALWGGLTLGTEQVRRIVALAPVTDLVDAARTNMGHGAAVEFIGGTLESRPEEFAEADPMGKLPGDVPVVIIQGSDDDVVPVAANRRVAEALGELPQFTYLELPNVEHFALIDPLSTAFVEHVLTQLSV